MADADAGRPTEPTTFVFTDVVGSTKLWAADPIGTARSFVAHDAVVRKAIASHNGELFGWAGDSFRAAFADRRAALEACAQVHRELAAVSWDGGPALRVRIGVTHGIALHRDGEYFGPVLNTAARLQEIAQPGQTVLGTDVADGLGDALVTRLGRHRIRDVAEEVELFQLGADGFAPLRTVDASRSTLPPVQGRLIGRAAMVAQVRAALDERCPVTVVGTAGAGKTRLALEVAHLELSDHPDGCHFVDLASVPDGRDIEAAVARSLRIDLAGRHAANGFGDWFGDWFADRRAMLVLDNCEHLVGAVKRFVDKLTARAPGLRILATSREPLTAASERVIRLGPLPTEDEGGPAVELFVTRIRDELPHFEPTSAQLSQIVDICNQLDGIPLALELAAARSGVLGLDHLLDGMHDRFRMLSPQRGDGSRTLRETIDWSYGLLTEQEQHLFACCGVFNGRFDLRAAAAIVPDIDPLDVADLLHSLTRKSLLHAEGSLGGRFRLLETIRAYALLRLAEADLEAPTRQRHFDHFHSLAAVEELEVAFDLDRAVKLGPHLSNLSAALEWGCAAGEWSRTAELAAGCTGLWETPSVPAVDGLRWIERILPHASQRPIAESILLYALASLEAQNDNFARVHEILAGLIDSPDPSVMSSANALLGYLKARTDPGESETLFDRCDELVSTLGLGANATATCCWTRGGFALYKPDLEAAETCFRTGFDVALGADRRTPNTVYTGLSLAVVQVLRGRPADALATLDRYNWADSRWDSSRVIRAIALIDLDQAAEATESVFGFAHEALLGRLNRMSNDAMLGFAALALHRGERDHAWTLLQQAVTPRTPFSIGLAEGLAARLGSDYEIELRRRHRHREVDLSELDARVHLQAELDRLSDGVHAHVAVSPQVRSTGVERTTSG